MSGETEPRESQPRGATPLRPGPVWLGFLVFGAVNFLVVFWVVVNALADPEGTPQPGWAGLIYLAIVAAASAISYFLLRWRSFAVGLAGGFVVMTVVSGGACTLLTESPEGFQAGLSLYLLGLLISGIVIAVMSVTRRRRGKG